VQKIVQGTYRWVYFENPMSGEEGDVDPEAPSDMDGDGFLTIRSCSLPGSLPKQGLSALSGIIQCGMNSLMSFHGLSIAPGSRENSLEANQLKAFGDSDPSDFEVSIQILKKVDSNICHYLKVDLDDGENTSMYIGKWQKPKGLVPGEKLSLGIGKTEAQVAAVAKAEKGGARAMRGTGKRAVKRPRGD